MKVLRVALGAVVALCASIALNALAQQSGGLPALQSDLATEVARAKAAETQLQTNISATQSSSTAYTDQQVAAESSRATAAEAALQSAIDAEGQRAKGMEGALDGKIASETAQRVTADTGLANDLAAEKAARQQADVDVQSAARAYTDSQKVTTRAATAGECPSGGTVLMSASGLQTVCNGAKGDLGDKGDKGDRGPAGPTGPPGPSGGFVGGAMAEAYFPLAGRSIVAIAADGTYAYVSTYTSPPMAYYIVKIDRGAGIVADVKVNYYASRLFHDGVNLWGWASSGDSLYRIDPSTLALIETASAGCTDSRCEIWDMILVGADLWIAAGAADRKTGEVIRMSATTFSVTNRYSLSSGYPISLVSDGQFVWVAKNDYYDARAYKIGIADNSVASSAVIGEYMMGIGLDGPDRVVVCTGLNSLPHAPYSAVTTLAKATLSEVSYIPKKQMNCGEIITDSRQNYWVSDGWGAVYRRGGDPVFVPPAAQRYRVAHDGVFLWAGGWEKGGVARRFGF